MPNIRGNIVGPEWSDCLSRLRDARALVLRDAESFHEAAMVLERVGQVLKGGIGIGLGDYKDALVELAGAAEGAHVDKVRRLFKTVKDARNMAVHSGAWARHLNTRLVDLFLLLEQAILNKMQCAEDLMVRQPIVAETWHLIGHIRQMLLANSFTALPVLLDGSWHFISDAMIVGYLGRVSNRQLEIARLSSSLEVAIHDGKIAPTKARCLSPNTKLEALVKEITKGPVLITEPHESSDRLLGIVTPFDLL